MSTPQVPRVQQMTAEQSAQEERERREWQRTRKLFQNDKARYGFGSPEAKAAWKARIQRTRSF